MSKLFVMVLMLFGSECLAYTWTASWKETTNQGSPQEVSLSGENTVLFSEKPKFFCAVTKTKIEAKSEIRFIACSQPKEDIKSMVVLECHGLPTSRQLLFSVGSKSWILELSCQA